MRTLNLKPARLFLRTPVRKGDPDLSGDRVDILLLHAVTGAVAVCTHYGPLSQTVSNKAEFTKSPSVRNSQH